ncbi:RPA49 polymerase, partial [Acromyrmex charruanus]
MKQLKAIIEDVIVQSNKIQPIIVNFQNGELKDEEVKEISCGLYREQKDNKTVLALSNGHIVYKGNRPDCKKESTRTMLVLHNKRTGKVRLFEAERWEVAPVLEKLDNEDNINDVDHKITILNKQFGSKKIKRRTEQFEKLKVNVESVKEQLEKTVSNVEINRIDLSSQLPNDDCLNAILPVCNRNASNVKDVYNIYDIIPKSKLEMLYEYAMKITDEDMKEKAEFFKHTLKIMQSEPDKVNKIALLLYIEMINEWFAMRITRKRDIVICSISEEVNQHIIDMYSVSGPNGRMRPNFMTDKGLVHSLILALTISNFTLDLEMFRFMFKKRTSLKKLMGLTKLIGAVPSKNDKKIIVLKVPMPPPVSPVKKTKKSAKSNQ